VQCAGGNWYCFEICLTNRLGIVYVKFVMSFSICTGSQDSHQPQVPHIECLEQQDQASLSQQHSESDELGLGEEATNRDSTWHLDCNDFRIFGFNSPLIYNEEVRMPVAEFSRNLDVHSRVYCGFECFAQERAVRQRMLCHPGQMQSDPKVLLAVGRDLAMPCCPHHNPEKICEIVNKVNFSRSFFNVKFERSPSGRFENASHYAKFY
jgi:hypothetical protein